MRAAGNGRHSAAMASSNVLVGRQCMIPRAHYPNLTPPDPGGWPARVTKYHSGGSQSRGGRGRRWGVLADDDVGKGRGAHSTIVGLTRPTAPHGSAWVQ